MSKLSVPRQAFAREVAGKHRMGIALARDKDIEKASEKARNAIAAIVVTL